MADVTPANRRKWEYYKNLLYVEGFIYFKKFQGIWLYIVEVNALLRHLVASCSKVDCTKTFSMIKTLRCANFNSDWSTGVGVYQFQTFLKI